MGLGCNDRIALVLPNGPEMAVACLAVATNTTCIPLNPAYGTDEFDRYLVELNAQALILQAGMESPARAVAQAHGICIIELLPMLEAYAGIFTLTGEVPTRPLHREFTSPGDVALVLHTSGTTSQPKIVPLTHANICTSAYNMCVALELLETDRCLNVIPLFYSHGLLGTLMPSPVAGSSIVCTPGFYAPQFFAWMADFRPTWYTEVPAIHQDILAHAALNREIIARCPLRFIRSGSASLPPQVLVELERVFHAPVIECYGMTETSSQVICNPLPPHQRKPGSVGVALGTEVAIMDEESTLLPASATGEIVIRGPNVIQGYGGDPAANRSSFTHGLFRTFDQGYLDPDG
jgi:acyl-CoA synthetase (AMP-forming)/AMP-acid ligase II